MNFFGFGYFDTLHAFVAVILFQFLVQIMVGSLPEAARCTGLVDSNDGSWVRAQWGQLCWVLHDFGLLIAGTTILGIRMSSVFVAEDLPFLCIGPEDLLTMNDKLKAVVAHDRATLGGMLWASGFAMLLPVLWQFKRGAGWLWSMVAGLGAPAYAAAVGVHYWVGYTDWRQLVPAFAGLRFVGGQGWR
ncbi:MAG: hypothetical protein J6386_16025 [Candidatus Synoicihabitans palmerolidicus]|nr:hypothetical protein [Candidatus Synoicihabitans palmerolidicus]